MTDAQADTLLAFNRTAYGIEINKVDLFDRNLPLLIAPLMELKYIYEIMLSEGNADF